MKRFILSCIIGILIFPLFSHSQWQSITKKEAVDFYPTLISKSNGEIVVEFSLDGFNLNEVQAPRANSKTISIPRTAAISEAGAPDLVQLTAPLIIPDLANMKIEVIDSEYFDIPNIEIAPSKGNFSRSIDPSTIPFTYGPAYSKDAWYPGTLAELADPHIHRDFRGTVAIVYPFQYNPATKILRVYNKLVVKVKESKSTAQPVNPFHRTKAITSMVEDFHLMYKNRYINYTPDKYTAPIERGRILVISHDAFIPNMTPYVRWKNQIGFPTEIVGVSTIGNTVTNIKSFVTNYYNTNGLAFLLLVGDIAQITSHSFGVYGLDPQTSDNFYGDILGNDMYLEVLVGRFSATTASHVNTQVTKVIEYEKATGMATNWQFNGLGLARNEGAGMGHDGGESDYVHMNNIRTRLLAYNYTTVFQEYDGNVPGIPNTTAAQISTRINNGVSIINFCNHGNETGWSVGYFSNTHVDALTNVRKLPFVWSVACLVGKFTITGDCFAETWLKATHNTTGEPTGALAFYGSTVNQPWLPPMDAQDEFSRIICELISGKIRKTYGAIAACGTMHMLDLDPADNDRLVTARTWTIFGDPSVMIRTDSPLAMTVTHNSTVPSGATNLLVNCNVNNAFVTLTKNFQIIGTGTISGGNANVTFASVATGDSILVTVTAYNKIPYEGWVVVQTPTIPLDLQALNIIDLASTYQCSGINVSPRVVIRNMGINTITSATIFYKLNTNPEQSIAWTGSLPSMQTDTVTLPSFVLTSGNHTYSFRTHSPNGSSDGNTANDNFDKLFEVHNLVVTADFTANILEFCENPAVVQFTNTSQNASTYTWDFGDGTFSNSENPVHEYVNLGTYSVTLIADAGVCGKDTIVFTNFIQVGALAPMAADQENCGPASFTFNAAGTGNIVWYSDPAGTVQVGTGSSFVTPHISNTTTYYLNTTVQNILFGGRLNNSGTGGFFTGTTLHGLVFNCTSPTLLKSVKVYFGGTVAANRTIRLEESNGTLIQAVTISVPPGESRITLNMNIPVGTGLRLMGGTSPNLFRNGAIGMNIGYPLAAGNNISITQSTASGFETNFYYYFYDWEVEENCKSSLNEVTAYILESPLASFSSVVNVKTVDFTNSSTGGNLTYSWDFGDGNFSTDKNPSHTYASSGIFNVTLTVTNLCGSNLFSQQVDLSTTNIQDEEISFEIYPNPADDYCLIQSPVMITLLEITDVQGRLLKSLQPAAKTVTINLSDFAVGTYFIRKTSENGILVKPLLVK